MKDAEQYQKLVDEMAFNIMYQIAGLKQKEINSLPIHEELEVSLDVISSMFKLDKNKIDQDIADAMAKINPSEIIQLKKERLSSVIH